MGGEWRTCRLGDVIELKRGYDLPTRQRERGQVQIISSSGPSGFHNEPMVKAPGVVTGRYGTIGEVFYVTEDFWPLNTTLYVRDFKESDPRFVSYFLRTLDFLAFSDKAAVPGVNRNHLHEAEIVWPEGHEQHLIAELLGSLDDKVELNRQMSRTLEEMARALFRNWFVDFDPVRAKAEGREAAIRADAADLFPGRFGDNGLPEGWSFRRADEIAALVRDGVEPSSLDPVTPYVGLEHLSKRQLTLSDHGHASDVDSIKTRFEKGDLLFGKLRPYFHKVSIAPEAGICSSDIFVFRAKPGFPTPYLYLAFSEDSFVAAATGGSTGTRMPRADWGHLRNEVFAMGDERVMRAFGDITAPMLTRTASLAAESRTLAALRDTLLPKLISGELRIPDAAALVEQAA
jgi:type I restriction enzyme S subunit